MQKQIIANDVFIPEIARLISDGSEVVFKPKGVSMLPFIRGGCDSVVLVSPKNIIKGDIVLAKVGNIYVLHRIIELSNSIVTLMGDGNIIGTEKCSRNDILAVAEKIIKGDKEIVCRSKNHQYKARVWRLLKPFRGYILFIYRRVILHL